MYAVSHNMDTRSLPRHQAVADLREHRKPCHLPRVDLRFLALSTFLLAVTACNRGPREVRLDLAVVARPLGGAGGSGLLQLDKRELYVDSESLVTIRFSNSANNPPKSRRFLLVQPGDGETLKPRDVLARGPIVAVGQSMSFRFLAPPAGNYEFFCSDVDKAEDLTLVKGAFLRGKFVVQ